MTTNSSHDDIITVAVFTGDPGHSVYKTVSRLLDLPFKLNVHILVHRPRKPFKRLFRNQLRNLRKHGWRWIPYQSAEIFSLLIGKFKSAKTTEIATGQRYSLQSLLDTGRVQLEAFPTVNGGAAANYLRTVPNLQLGISLAAPILKASTFAIPALGTLNLHKGKLPEYRGMPPAFWELSAGESQVGVSVHFVDEGLDTGAIVKTDTVPIEPYSSPAGLRVGLDEKGHELVCRAVSDILDGNMTAIPQTGHGKTNSRPTLEAEWRMARSIARKEGAHGAKRRLKNTILYSYYATKRVGEQIGVVKPKITILLYHRVSDAFRDSVTVGIEQFDSQLKLLKDNYPVRPLRTLLDGSALTGGEQNILCITFDDGYLDNYTNAAPLLVKYGLPATFFVSTGKVSHQTPFQHDLDKLGYGLPNMTWDNIREMAAEGFEFGSHTVNHTDLGNASEEQILRELVESKQTIETELRQDGVPFAYPYGQRHHFTERARAMVKEVGYTCCCSAFGGHNTANEWDSFRIYRTGVSYNFSLTALQAKIHGWKNA